MSGDDRQSRLAREHRERQAQRAQQTPEKSKRSAILGVGIGAVVVVGGIIAGAVFMGGGDEPKPAAAGSPSPSAPSETPSELPTTMPSPTVKPGSVTCEYRKDDTGVPTKFVGYPPKKPSLRWKNMTLETNHGNIVIELATSAAPCAVNSFAFLAKKNFYDGNKCHRLATMDNSGLKLIQCGDPRAKADGKSDTDGLGTSGYLFNDENTGILPTRGVVILPQPADGSNMNNSQFAISYGEETSQIGGDLSTLGVVTTGLEILDKIAAGGYLAHDGDVNGDGGSSAPKIPLTIKDVKLSM
ncbi:peptidyl-prolyl cis-trans isomerase B (cyclophilin B) [Sinosporangium album]|uniref:Peptidyl-prolyl cis-trans isomerase B (Cyclophilin B) n=1 Tax=Sinosporangium album TaxID=504805 RepID=A0A1G8IWI2_9ACTN|nr:peptidylprolyl isomerase [Sinosporangium album]SDI23289.1 peptidyl-prolyl cis-trans isomerase B (cyclophilin B) [Sinosporangium album]